MLAGGGGGHFSFWPCCSLVLLLTKHWYLLLIIAYGYVRYTSENQCVLFLLLSSASGPRPESGHVEIGPGERPYPPLSRQVGNGEKTRATRDSLCIAGGSTENIVQYAGTSYYASSFFCFLYVFLLPMVVERYLLDTIHDNSMVYAIAPDVCMAFTHSLFRSFTWVHMVLVFREVFFHTRGLVNFDVMLLGCTLQLLLELESVPTIPPTYPAPSSPCACPP